MNKDRVALLVRKVSKISGVLCKKNGDTEEFLNSNVYSFFKECMNGVLLK